MKLLSIAVITATLLTASPAFAFVGCVTIPTPDTAAVGHPASVKKAGSNANHGYTGTPGQNGCPIKAAPGTCVTAHASLSEKVDSQYVPPFTTYDGIVPDNHRKTLFGFPVGPVLPNPCP